MIGDYLNVNNKKDVIIIKNKIIGGLYERDR